MPIGDICWIYYPNSDGHEQAGGRPGLVIQDDSFASDSPLVLTIPITSAAATLSRYPAVVAVPATRENGLTKDSCALVFQLRAVDRRRVREQPIGVIELNVLDQIYQALGHLIGRISLTVADQPRPTQREFPRDIDPDTDEGSTI
ncbi:MAG: type II toxin-antitoxin system PemK/MazF family toxin [Bacteroidales bacterium]|nr:type II toxin-antitoxin system PemK/MazF family toxin [Bacteroidales bacterium]